MSSVQARSTLRANSLNQRGAVFVRVGNRRDNAAKHSCDLIALPGENTLFVFSRSGRPF
jgi:hypothetical protein